jgi:hypothetical protein
MAKKISRGGSSSLAAMQYNFTNLMSVLIFMGPYILVSFFILLSIFTMSGKGIVYFGGVSILVSILSFLQNKLPSSNSDNLTAMCKLFGSQFNIPSSGMNSGIYAFTIVYLFTSMITNNIMNIPLFVLLVLLYTLDCMFNIKFGCVNAMTIMVVTAISAIFGFGWAFLAKQTKMEYYSEYVSDKLACSMPKKQHYKCKMYHNGELVTTFEQGHSHGIDPTDVTENIEVEDGKSLQVK